MFLLRSSYESFKEICFLHSFFFIFWGRSCSSSQTSSVVRGRFQHSHKKQSVRGQVGPRRRACLFTSVSSDVMRRDEMVDGYLSSPHLFSPCFQELCLFSLVVFWTCCCWLSCRRSERFDIPDPDPLIHEHTLHHHQPLFISYRQSRATRHEYKCNEIKIHLTQRE